MTSNPDMSPDCTRLAEVLDHTLAWSRAQGILIFYRRRDACPGLAGCIAGRSLGTLHHPGGRFYYQQTRHYIKRFTQLRWCNGWMTQALAVLLRDGWP